MGVPPRRTVKCKPVPLSACESPVTLIGPSLPVDTPIPSDFAQLRPSSRRSPGRFKPPSQGPSGRIVSMASLVLRDASVIEVHRGDRVDPCRVIIFRRLIRPCR